nr:PhzF family phenazine biosynthesis protein [Kineococcus indalonis]
MDVLRYAAFTDRPEGGNPAGVVLDARGASDARMLAVAAEVGFAETAFVVRPADDADPRWGVRYFSPHAEVPFCGHATVATAVALAERAAAGAPAGSGAPGSGTVVFDTPVGEVVVRTTAGPEGVRAAFTSVPPRVGPLAEDVLDRLLALIGARRADLDGRFPVRTADAGNPHPLLFLAAADVFDTFTFEPAAVRALMDEQGWTGTVSVLRALGPDRFEARNLFPVGAITEDPATGSAAAALGGYLRELALVPVPSRVQVHQGRHVGRPGLLTVDVPRTGGVVVSGRAVAMG